jgi:hypothetical protein
VLHFKSFTVNSHIINIHITIVIVDIVLCIVVTCFGKVFINIRDKVSYFLFYFLCAVKPMSLPGQNVVQKILSTTRKSLLKLQGSGRRILVSKKLKKPCQNTKLILWNDLKGKSRWKYFSQWCREHNYQGLLYCQNVIWFDGVWENIIAFTPTRKERGFPVPIFTKLSDTQQYFL